MSGAGSATNRIARPSRGLSSLTVNQSLSSSLSDSKSVSRNNDKFNNDNNNGSHNNNNSNNSNNGDNTPSSSSSNKDKDNSPSASAAKTSPCVGPCIKDNDPRLTYQGPWTLASDSAGNTFHSTVTPGSTVSLSFNGSGIVAFGSIAQSSATNPPPTIDYILDDEDPVTRNEPQAASKIQNQPLFEISSLSHDEHTLVINITLAGAPFILDSFFVFPNNKSDVSLEKPSSSKPPLASSTSSLSGGSSPRLGVSEAALEIMAGVLGSVIIILLCVLLYLLILLRRRSRLNRLPEGAVAEPYPFYRQSLKSRTIFTSSDSILQNHPETNTRNTVSTSPRSFISWASHLTFLRGAEKPSLTRTVSA